MSHAYPLQPFVFEETAAPLGGNLALTEGAEDVLPQDFLTEVEACLRFEDPALMPVNAAGRSYFLALPERIGVYDALQVSGGGYVDNGLRSIRNLGGLSSQARGAHIIRALSSKREPFETAGTSFIDDNGQPQVVYSNGILGTYSGEQAEVKAQKTHDVWQRLNDDTDCLVVPRVVGKFAYDLSDGQGDSQTAVLMLVPNNGLRIDHDLTTVNIDLLGQLDPAEQKRRAHEILREELPHKLHAVGFGIAKVHDLGFAHNQMHLGNLGTVEQENGALTPFVADWDTSRRPSESFKNKAQAQDFGQVILSLMRWLSDLNAMTEIPPFWGTAKLLGNTVLHGYASYYNHPEPESLKIPAGEMVRYATTGYDIEDLLTFFGNLTSSAHQANG